jgi:hypothetical protein
MGGEVPGVFGLFLPSDRTVCARAAQQSDAVGLLCNFNL